MQMDSIRSLLLGRVIQSGSFKFEPQLVVWTYGARAGCARLFPAH